MLLQEQSVGRRERERMKGRRKRRGRKKRRRVLMVME